MNIQMLGGVYDGLGVSSSNLNTFLLVVYIH